MPTKTISCRDVALRLQTYLDGELDDDRMDRIHAHLDACADCGLDADVFREIKSELAQRARPVDPEALARLRAFTEQIAQAEPEAR